MSCQNIAFISIGNKIAESIDYNDTIDIFPSENQENKKMF